MKRLKKLLRLLGFIVLLVLAAVGGGLMAIATRRPDQDYDNEIKTELVEGKQDQSEMTNRN
jgi:hypothetical protein